MATTYVKIDTSDLKGFVGKLDKAAQGEFKKELVNFMEGLGYEFLRIVQDEIIRKQTVDTRLLLNSFSKGEQDNIFVLNEGHLSESGSFAELSGKKDSLFGTMWQDYQQSVRWKVEKEA